MTTWYLTKEGRFRRGEDATTKKGQKPSYEEVVTALQEMIAPFCDDGGGNGSIEISEVPFLRSPDWWNGKSVSDRVQDALAIIEKARPRRRTRRKG